MVRKSRVLLFVAMLGIALGIVAQVPNTAFAQSSRAAVYSDDMSNAAFGLLSEASTDPSRYSFRYTNGQFIAQAVERNYIGEIFSFVGTPNLSDSITSVDVGIGGADEREIYAFVGCRAGLHDEGYMFLLEPTTGRAAIWRQDAAGPVLLAETFVRNLVTPGNNQFNRLEIDCYLDLISASVNGTVVLAEFDNTYADGLSYIGIGNTGGAPDNLFGVFDNLTVIDQGSAVSTTAAPANPSQSFTMLPDTRLAGPLAGQLVDQATTISTASAGVLASDFFATATFTVPSTTVTWDVTIGFRDGGTGNEYRLIILSTGQWRLSMGTGAAFATGTVSNLATAPGQENVIDLLVQGRDGAAALNGTDFAVFDLSASTVFGDVWLATASFGETTQVGRTTTYRNFEVWSLA